MGPQEDEKKLTLSKPAFGLFGEPMDPANQSPMRTHLIAMSGEFVGTFMFLLFAFLGHTMAVTTAPNFGPADVNSNQTVLIIALSYGFSLLVTVWMMYRVSGGLFNPAVTMGLAVTGNIPMVRALLLFPVQIIAGICAAGIAAVIIPGDIKLVQTTLTPGMSPAQGVFLEMFLTAQLIFTVLMLAAEKSKDTFIAPIGIGLSLFVAEIAGVFYTGASLNPARSFGPCVVGRNFQSYHWIYWVGPFLGTLIASGYYHFCKLFNYESANPGQDSANGQFDAHVEEEAASPGADSRNSMNMDTLSRGRSGTGTGAQQPANVGQPRVNGGYHPGYDASPRV
ncbi:hypothetical protein LTR53_000115 [Teratosphaeriaceae sp. CCFEE 6253]|nr:hypothetical protein LTR53_000115 [Teratosphaeriaceae sp. CCFEE 6253]